MKISIIVPVYNLENNICETLESICNNDLSNVEIIVVDDGSTDNSRKIAGEYLEKYAGDEHFSIIDYNIDNQLNNDNCNRGVSAARNLGIRYAKGKFVIFVDGDDKIETDLIEKITDDRLNDDIIFWGYYKETTALNNKQVDCTTIAKVKYPEFFDFGLEKSTDRNIILELWMKKGLGIRLGSFAVSRKYLIENNIYFDEGEKYGEDISFIMKILSGTDRISFIQGAYYYYCNRDGSAIKKGTLERLRVPKLLEKVYMDYYRDNNMINTEVKNYMRNEFFLLHAIHSINGAITGCKNIREILAVYKGYKKCEGLDERIMEMIGNIKELPGTVTKNRIILLRISRLLYMIKIAIS